MIRIDIWCTKQNSENGSTEQGRFLDAFWTLSRPLQKGVGRFREQRTLSRPKCRNSGEGRFLDAFGRLIIKQHSRCPAVPSVGNKDFLG